MDRENHGLYQNPLSKFSGVMAIMVFTIDAILLLFDYIGIRLYPVIGVLAYTLFPALLFFYLALIPVGMYRERQRRNKQSGLGAPLYPCFDFNVKNQRTQLYVFILGTSLVGLLVLVVGFRSYEFTESVFFCSELCHKVMEPEATTYKNSPHARVTCVECHVGEGATWYMKSKLSGLYQVYATIFNKYPRPIETPIEDLRPSSETCERCHWPSKFYGSRQVTKTYYQDDEKNTPRQFQMLMNVGGGISPTGIHWHVGQDEVYYVARDKKRQDLPWIKVKHKDGREVVYTDQAKPPTAEELVREKPRKMDCIDCHNRPTHIFKSPSDAMDEALEKGLIDASLPYIKKMGTEILSKDYKTNEEAALAIHDGILDFYKERHPQVVRDSADKIENAVRAIQKIWENNNFPHMKSKWSVYPNNVGHMKWPGCFRCHDGEHKSKNGEAIKKNCNICHIFLSEKASDILTRAVELGRPFKHPADVAGQENILRCDSCHAN